jgi:hypothetical protein
MALSRRYSPEHPPGESCNFGLDYSYVIPPGVGITSGTLHIFLNTYPYSSADTDWTASPVTVSGRTVYCRLTGGVEGKDYRLTWTVIDTDGNSWPRTTLCLCAQTS